jgi:hypothetical protein
VCGFVGNAKKFMPVFIIPRSLVKIPPDMKKLFLFSLILTIFKTMHAQTQNVAGEYYLQGVMETASGFKLDRDSTFQFFFSYGALDRYGSGKWSMSNNKIILNSKAYPGKDFKLVNSVNKNDHSVTVQIENSNPNVYRWVHCLVPTEDGDTLFDATSDGIIQLPSNTDTIRLVSEFCSERISSFAVDKTKFNYFTFNFEPWAAEVFFKNFELQFVTDHLEGKHPLLQDKIYEYVK